MREKKEFFLRYLKGSVPKAQTLRKNMTDAERKLWSFLRDSWLGAHFRRQVPLGTYIADFLCHKAKLVIEVDGGQHYQNDGID